MKLYRHTHDNTCLVCFPFKNVVISLKPGVHSCYIGNEGTQLLHSISIVEWVQILCSVSRHLYNGKFVLVYLSMIFVCMYIFDGLFSLYINIVRWLIILIILRRWYLKTCHLVRFLYQHSTPSGYWYQPAYLYAQC